MEPMPAVTIYTDGACRPNPGPGGWGAVLLFEGRRRPVDLFASAARTTNNRMELTAAIEALKSLPAPHRVALVTDSTYLKNGITQWLPVWTRQQWQKKDRTPVKNQDLWQALAGSLQLHTVSWHWVKGHAGDKWNERADALARMAFENRSLPLSDHGAIHIFTAVSLDGKSGTGGWCAVLRYRRRTRVLTGTEDNSTGNRLHLLAAVEALAAVRRPLPIHLYTHSGYLRDGATRWIRRWAAEGWQTAEGRAVRNRDLWQRIGPLCKRSRVRWHIAGKTEPPCDMQAAKIMGRDAIGDGGKPPMV
jgi:ribonuclease HI